MKIKGAELKSFMDEGWPQPEPDWYWDHEAFHHNPISTETYDTNDLGPILYQGRGADPTKGDGYDLASCIRQWRKYRKFEEVVVLVKKDRVDDFKKALKGLGARRVR